jgi:hypothetical protein
MNNITEISIPQEVLKIWSQKRVSDKITRLQRLFHEFPASTRVELYFHLEYRHFPHEFLTILHTLLALMFIYCRQKPTAAKLIVK